MKFIEVDILGAYLIELDLESDERGFFSRVWCEREFDKMNLESHITQCNLSYNKHKGTIRGLHYQNPPDEEAKVVRCINGSVFDVIVDIRRESPTYLKHFSIVLSSQNRRSVFVPKGCAHGIQAMEDNAGVLYFSSTPYNAESESCIRWNDPAFDIVWPEEVTEISVKDSSAANWKI